jgi:hypothetical protein
MKILITRRNGDESGIAGTYDIILAYGRVSQELAGSAQVYSVAWGEVKNDYPKFQSMELCGHMLVATAEERGQIICGMAVAGGIFDGPCVIELMPDRPPLVQWNRRVKIEATIRGAPLFTGIAFSRELPKLCGSNTRYGEFYLGRIRDPADAICGDELSEAMAEVSRLRIRVAGMSSGVGVHGLAAAAKRYSVSLARYKELEKYICSVPPQRSVEEVQADISALGERPVVPRPAGRRPPADLAALRAELAEIERELAAPAPVLHRENPSRLAELEGMVPCASGLPEDLARQVSAHLAKMPEHAELIALRAARDKNVGARKTLATRINLEGRRGVIKAALQDCGNAAAWDEYTAYKKWRDADAKRAGLYRELAAARQYAENAELYRKYIAMREEAFNECMYSAQAYGALAGAASTMPPEQLAADISATLAELAAAEKRVAEIKAARATALAPFHAVLGEISGPSRLRECIAMAKIYGGAPICAVPEVGQLAALAAQYFPVIVVPTDAEANYYVTLSQDKYAICTCGARIKTALMPRHLRGKKHAK